MERTCLGPIALLLDALKREMKTSVHIVTAQLSRAGILCLAAGLLTVTITLPARADVQTVHVLFDLSAPTAGPSPSDRFTLPDGSQNTGRRVNLPLPSPGAFPSDYQDISVLNTLDGFNLQPRLSVPFDGPIDPSTATSSTIFLICVGDTLPSSAPCGHVVGINQIVWDPQSNTLHAKSDELLEQHSQYVLLVTSGVRDSTGSPIEASESFRRFRHDLNYGQDKDAALKEYRKSLINALEFAEEHGTRPKDVVAASVFTTMSATAVLEKIRDQIKAGTPERADFLLGPGGTRSVYKLDQLTGITVNQQTGDNPPKFTSLRHPVELLRIIPGAVDRIAFGRYLSPNYECAAGYIPAIGTKTGTPIVQGVNQVYFNLYLPSGAPPPQGWPVAIYGHGSGGSKQGGTVLSWGSLAVAASLAEQGIATIAINAVGHGFGPLSTLTISQSIGDPIVLCAGGRGIDQNGDGIIENDEGISADPPWSIIRNLDPSRIYYCGQSLGGIYGTVFLAVEPAVRVGVANVPGGSAIESARLSTIFRRTVGRSLASRTPPLLNGPAVTSLDGVAVLSPGFDENMPLRDGATLKVRLADGTDRIIQSPLTNRVTGAMRIQEVFEHTEWASQSANPVAYAPYLRRSPLAGVPAKSVLFQFAKGDQVVPNPASTAILRAGELADRAIFYRHDLAYAENPLLPKIPHAFLTNIGLAAFREIALGAQRQIATFFSSDGNTLIHPDPARFFEVPIELPLPENLGYIP
ncbi:MAG: hypothetical protein LC772_01365 [Chloroflexi bacterium]|nr:hypothetical protein [Chloroflexota bacterium]